MPFRSLRSRLVVAIGGLVIALTAATLTYVSRLAGRAVDERVSADLVRSRDTLAATQLARYERLTLVARLLSSFPGLLGLMDTNAPTIRDFLIAYRERNARDELTRILGPGGFDANRDIVAITVNRWGHGYSYSGSTLDDKEGDDEKIPALARKRAGRVAFANADANWEPYAHAAIDQGRRAVDELLGKPAGKPSK